MPLKYPITFIENPTEQDHHVIFKGINEFATSQGLNATAGSCFFAVYDENKTMVAALHGFDNFGPVEIGGLWVHEALRGQGYGRALVQKTEEWGRQNGCKFATVFTLKEWPVCAWYQKLGFKIEFERPGHANNTVGCYLIKKLYPEVG
jgi:ribosomal protein S18 acetylase RimI-like enzyme